MIAVESLSKTFGDRLAVDHVTFNARQGEILGVLGPNGAGKTTTLRIICGYLVPTAGTARVDGLDVATDSLQVRRRIGYLPENTPLYPEMRVVEYLTFRAGIKGTSRRDRHASVDRAVGLCHLTDVTRQTIGTLSKGYRQRVGLADALLGNPRVLVLDEPTAGLDPNQRHDTLRLISSLRGSFTILLSSHLLSEVEQVCDRVVIFRRGQVIAEGTPHDLEQRLTGADSLTLEAPVEARLALAALVADLGRLDDVHELGDGWLRATLAAHADVRAEIFRRASSAGVTLRELTRRGHSLEQIFHELTAAPDERAADASAGKDPADSAPVGAGDGTTEGGEAQR